MKRVLLSLSIVALFAATSCNSEKDCECETFVNGTSQSTTTTTIEDGECSDLESSSSSGGSSSKVECEEV